MAFWTAGQTIEMDGAEYELDRQIGNEWQLFNRKTRRAIQMSVSKLLGKYASGEVCFPLPGNVVIPESIQRENGSKIAAHLDVFPEDVVELMKRRRLLLECHLKECGDKRSQVWLALSINKYWDDSWKDAPSPSTAARLLKRYMESGKDIRSLAPRHYKKGNFKQRYQPEVTDICLQVIKNIYLQPTRGSIGKTVATAQAQTRALNRIQPQSHMLSVPTPSYIQALIREIPEYDRYAARYGRTAADNKFRNAAGNVTCDRPLQRVEVDHTLMDIMVVDGASGLVMGRPYLTLVTDVYTRTILGFHLSFDPPSHMVVAKALRMALLPKNHALKKWRNVQGKWPMYGCMQELVVDNGLEFHGKSLEAACLQLGIDIAYCPRKQGRKKPHVERLIGTLNRSLTDGMPGRTFASKNEKGDYDPVKNAAIPLETLEEMIAKWIVDIYHEEFHATLGVPPRVDWEESISDDAIPLVPDTSELDAIMGVIAERKLSHRGIEINSLRYNCKELGDFRMNYGDLEKVTIKWNPEDLSYIHVLPPDGSILRVPVVAWQQEYATGLSLYLHTQCQQYLKSHHGGGRHTDQLIEARMTLHELAIKAVHSTKKKLRGRASRLANTMPEQASLNSQLTHTVAPEITPDNTTEMLIATSSASVQRRKFATEIRNLG